MFLTGKNSRRHALQAYYIFVINPSFVEGFRNKLQLLNVPFIPKGKGKVLPRTDQEGPGGGVEV
jgi:hypothetical protein